MPTAADIAELIQTHVRRPRKMTAGRFVEKFLTNVVYHVSEPFTSRFHTETIPDEVNPNEVLGLLREYPVILHHCETHSVSVDGTKWYTSRFRIAYDLQ